MPARNMAAKRNAKTMTIDISPRGLLLSAATADDPLERRVSLWALRELCPNFPNDLTPFYDLPQYQPAKARAFAKKTLTKFEKVKR